MSKILKAGDLVDCPKCLKPQEALVEECVIPGRTGERSRATEQCVDCDAYFSVMLTPAGDFVVDLADADH
jgi:hypothetical protein